MSRVLRLELRRSAAAGVALILALVGAAMLYAATQRWAPGWMALAVVQREYTVLLWPLTLAAGAWQGRRDHRSKVDELFGTTPRPYAQRMLPIAGAMGLAVAFAYVVGTAAAAPWIADTATRLPLAFFVTVAVGALSLAGAAWVGLAVGRLAPTAATAPALAVAGFALIMFGPFAVGDRDWLAMVFSPTWGMNLYYDYQTIADRVSGAQAVWFAALGLAGVLLLVARSRWSRTAALLPVVLGATAAIAIMPHDDEVLTPIDPVAQAQVCTRDAPRVCVSRVHEAVLPEVAPRARQALEMLSKLPGAPVGAQEDTTTYGPDTSPPRRADLLLLTIRIDAEGGLAHRDVLLPEAVGAAFQPLADCDNRGYRTPVARAAAFYLMGTAPLSAEKTNPETISEDPETNVEAVALWQGLRRLPAQEALARVAKVRRAALDCGELEGLLSR
ncbi:hypothetical protein [Actinoplanes sp. NPDC051494]|uniref:hypothetical protein n=1 Tax=Actinoplanes sp. NPDC051494 TaxID=3363907 RepID=UPI0037B1B41E